MYKKTPEKLGCFLFLNSLFGEFGERRIHKSSQNSPFGVFRGHGVYAQKCVKNSFSGRRKINPRPFFSESKLIGESPILVSPTILFKHFCFESAENRHHLPPNQNSNHLPNPKTSDTTIG